MPQQESLIQEGVMTLNQLLNMTWGWKTKSRDELEFEDEVNQVNNPMTEVMGLSKP